MILEGHCLLVWKVVFMKRMLIVENDGFLRELLKNYFDDSHEFEVSAVLADASLAPALCFNRPIDILLMDICTDDDNRGGIKAAEIIKRRDPRIKIVLMTGIPETNYIKEAKAAGVNSFVYKNDTIENLYDTVKRTMEGEEIWPSVSEKMPNTLNLYLSERENEVARLICCECLTRQEIGERLNLSSDTIKTITSRILLKANVPNSRQLMKLMLSNDYFKPEDNT